MSTLIPDANLLAIESISCTDGEIVLRANTIRGFVQCPVCRQPTNKVHSRYGRTPADLPWEGIRVRIHLTTRKFACENGECPRRIFCERLPGCLERYAHRTARLNQALSWIGLALGGEARARLAIKLGHSVSPATLLHRVRSGAINSSSSGSVSVLGVDDFALRRGASYGTILVDLEKRRVMDLFPGREAQPFADWLRDHPGVTIVSRDRAPAYHEGATRGAPEAIQVADRWHLIKNLTSAFEDFLNQQASVIRAHWQQVYAADLEPTFVESPPNIERVVPPTESEYTRSRSCQSKRQQWHAERKARYDEIQELKRQGKNVGQISRIMGVSYSQTRSHYYASEYQVIHRQAHGSQVEQYAEYLRRRWAEGCDNAQQLHREIAAQGYRGSRVTVWRYVYPWRKADAAAKGMPLPAPAIRPPKRCVPNARECVWLLLKPEIKLTEEEKQSRQQLLKIEPVNRALLLVQEFRELLAAGKGDQFDEWVQKAEKTEGSPFKGFLHGVRRDSEAVHNAFRSPWSNGQTEGQVNRLKFIKRQMFGRANFDLLRIRVLSEI